MYFLFERPGWTPLLLGVVCAAGLHVHQPALPPLNEAAAELTLAWILAGLLVMAGQRLPRQPWGPWPAAAAWLAGFGLALWLAFSWMNLLAHWRHPGVIASSWEGVALRLHGVIVDLPQPHEDSWRFRFEITEAWHESTGERVTTPERVLLGWYGLGRAGDGTGQLVLRAGERWALSVRLKQVHGQMNPGGFDFERWAWEHGIGATGTVRHGANDRVALRLAQTSRDVLAQWRQSMRDRIHERIPDKRWASILAGLVLGDTAGIERADWDVFRATGIAHLISISGLHVTLLAWWLRAVVIFLWRRTSVFGTPCSLWLPAPWAGLLLGLAAAWAYALFSGWGLPAQRTVCMLTLSSWLHVSGRRWPTPLVWCVVLASVLWWDPLACLQPGFWLSYVAVGVLFAGASQAHPLPRSAPAGLVASMRRWGHEQMLMTVTLSPLCLLFFQEVSLVGLAANAVAIPWITLWVTPLALLGMGWPWLWTLSADSLSLLMQLLTPLAAWSGATWQSAEPPWGLSLFGLLGALCLVLPGPVAWRAWGLPLLMPCFFWQSERPAPDHFELLAADVGQGSAVLVRTAHHALLYDTGPHYSRETDAGQRVIIPVLRKLHEKLDAVVLSHQDSDHTGGALSVLAMQPQAKVWSGIPSTHVMAALGDSQACLAGQRWYWDGVLFEFLHPSVQDYKTQRPSNALSCVLKISSLGRAVLLAGDIEKAQEKSLIETWPGLLQADVLLVPHHGSLTSSSVEFVAAVRPAWAWVQAGYRNRFGHPAQVVKARYLAQQARWVVSSQCGAVLWHSQRPEQVRCAREQGRRFWHRTWAPEP